MMLKLGCGSLHQYSGGGIFGNLSYETNKQNVRKVGWYRVSRNYDFVNINIYQVGVFLCIYFKRNYF